jgi:hypothetical protein
MKWFRFYGEALDDPKVQRLPAHLFKTWANLLCIASQGGGKLPSDDDIAFRLRMSVHDAASNLDDLILAGLIDIDAKGVRRPHNWEKRQYVSDTSTGRVRKHRKRKKIATGNSDETFQETPPEQNRSDQSREDSPPAPRRGSERGKSKIEIGSKNLKPNVPAYWW